MKGTARPSWTDGRHKWLHKLKTGTTKPKGTAEGSVATYCRSLGWSAIRPPLGHVITQAGLDMLARWDAGDCKVHPKPKPAGFKITGLTAVELATRLLDVGRAEALAVYEALHTGLFGTMPTPHQRRCPVNIAAPPAVMREGAPTECDRAPPTGCDGFGADPGIEVGATSHAPSAAPRNLTPSLGKRVTASGYSECLRCCGRGTVAHNFVCPACHGNGTIRRTVQP